MKKQTKIRGLIDRIEDGFAVILLGDEEEVVVELPDCYLPPDIKEGDLVTFKLEVHCKKTKEAKQKVSQMIKSLKA